MAGLITEVAADPGPAAWLRLQLITDRVINLAADG